MLSKPPTEKQVTTKSAPTSARAPISFGPDLHREVPAPRDLVPEVGHELGPARIEVVEHDLRTVERGVFAKSVRIDGAQW